MNGRFHNIVIQLEFGLFTCRRIFFQKEYVKVNVFLETLSNRWIKAIPPVFTYLL